MQSKPNAKPSQAPSPAPASKPRVTSFAFWDDIAEKYEERAHPYSLLFARSMYEHISVGPDTLVLDVAAGTGAASIPAAKRGARVLAVDFSQEMLRRLRAKQVPNIEVRQMDGQALKLPDGRFDVSVSLFGVMLFEDWQAGLREMARVTKAGGSVAVVTWRDPGGAGINQVVHKISRELFPEISFPDPPAGMVELSDPKRLAQHMRAAGLEVQNVKILSEFFFFRIDEVFHANPSAKFFSEEQRKAILQELRLRYSHGEDRENLRVESKAVLVVAKKPGIGHQNHERVQPATPTKE